MNHERGLECNEKGISRRELRHFLIGRKKEEERGGEGFVLSHDLLEVSTTSKSCTCASSTIILDLEADSSNIIGF